jgi:hypothetical protein
MVTLITIATDQGMKAMDIMATVFPPEIISQFEETSKKYHELQSHRQDGNIDADQVQVASDAFAEFAKLDVDWQSYRKEKAEVVPQADHRLALMLLADGLAATTIPSTVQSLQAEVTSISSNLFQLNRAMQLKTTIQLLVVVGKQMPNQVESFKTVRGIAKKIAAAENMTLPPDPPADSLKDTATASKDIITLLPPDSPAVTPNTPAAAPEAVPAASIVSVASSASSGTKE